MELANPIGSAESYWGEGVKGVLIRIYFKNNGIVIFGDPTLILLFIVFYLCNPIGMSTFSQKSTQLYPGVLIKISKTH